MLTNPATLAALLPDSRMLLLAAIKSSPSVDTLRHHGKFSAAKASRSRCQTRAAAHEMPHLPTFSSLPRLPISFQRHCAKRDWTRLGSARLGCTNLGVVVGLGRATRSSAWRQGDTEQRVVTGPHGSAGLHEDGGIGKEGVGRKRRKRGGNEGEKTNPLTCGSYLFWVTCFE
jgi:hypothetical protein